MIGTIEKKFTELKVTPENAEAYFAVKATVEGFCRGESVLPLILMSHGQGKGKSHLLGVAENVIAEMQPQAKVISMTGNQFIGGYIQAVREGKYDVFESNFDSADVLIIDDVECITDNSIAEKQFIYTLGRLHMKQALIFIAADISSKKSEDFVYCLDYCLKGRKVEIEMMDTEGRISMLKDCLEKEKAIREKIFESEEMEQILELIANSSDENLATMERNLRMVIYSAELYERSFTLDFAKEVVGG